MIDIASEFRYRNPPMTKSGLSLFVSQSGETMDTLAALRYVDEHQRIVSVVNSQDPCPQIGRVLPTLAGPGGVASASLHDTVDGPSLFRDCTRAGTRRDRPSARGRTRGRSRVPGRAAEV